MRVTTEFFVAALVRRTFGTGGFAAVLKRGATEAGAVFVVARSRQGELALFAPAPQTSYEAGRPEDRRFRRLDLPGEQAAIDARLQREERFDSDIWIVEIEEGGVSAADLLAPMPI